MPPTTPQRPSTTHSIATTILLLAILILALFPSLFHYTWHIPLYILSPLLSPLLPSSPPTTVPTSSSCPPPPALQTSRAPITPPATTNTMSFFQKTLHLPASGRGSHLITEHITSSLPEIASYKIGLLNLFVQHTSCALSLNENWDEDVRADMDDALDRLVPEEGDREWEEGGQAGVRANEGKRTGKKGVGKANGGRLYRHSAEGSDDMPAHIKSALIGASITIPIRDGKLATGTWQGIWYLEFRNSSPPRKAVATIQGEKA